MALLRPVAVLLALALLAPGAAAGEWDAARWRAVADAWAWSGVEERLAALDAALLGGLAPVAPFPPDAPGDDRGRTPTLAQRFEVLGWASVPLLVERVDEEALTRRYGDGPAGFETVGDVAWSLLRVWGLPEVRRASRGGVAREWWEAWRERGPLRCCLELLAERRRSGQPVGDRAAAVARMLGPAAIPLLQAELEPLDWKGRRARSRALLPWIEAAASLRETALAPCYEAAFGSVDLEVALAGARGLVAIGHEPARARASRLAWRAAHARGPFTGPGLGLLGALDPRERQRCLRDLGAPCAEAAPELVELLLARSDEVDARLGLLRLAALRLGGFVQDEDHRWGVEGGPAALEALARRAGLATRDGEGPIERATALLLRDAPGWRDDPERRLHAVVTALLLGPCTPDLVARVTGVEPRRVVLEGLVGSDAEGGRALREGLGPRGDVVVAWLRTWLAAAGDPRLPAALGVLDHPAPPRLALAAVEVGSGVGAGLEAAVGALPDALDEQGLLGLLRAWAGGDGPGLRFRLVRAGHAGVALRVGVEPRASGFLGLLGRRWGAGLERQAEGPVDPSRVAAAVAELFAGFVAAHPDDTLDLVVGR